MDSSSALPSAATSQRLDIPGTDLTVAVSLDRGELTVVVNKANRSVFRVVVEEATMPMENAWLADMFMRDDRMRMADLSAEVEDYVRSLNIAQG